MVAGSTEQITQVFPGKGQDSDCGFNHSRLLNNINQFLHTLTAGVLSCQDRLNISRTGTAGKMKRQFVNLSDQVMIYDVIKLA